MIQKEQRSLEEQSSALNDVATNTQSFAKARRSCSSNVLSANTGNLLDDEELIAVLAETKTKAVEVNEKLLAAGTTRASYRRKTRTI